MKLQRGQSMTEFAAGTAAMGLLLLGSITIAGYQELQRRNTFAARQGAFQVAWSGARADRAEVLRQVAEFQMDDPGLIDAVGRNRTVRPSDITVQASIQPAPGLAHGAAQAMVTPLRVVGGFFGGEFDLSTNGLLEGSVNVNIAPQPYLPAPFNEISLQLRQPFALMTDAWNAAGASHVRNRTAGLVPTTALSGMQALWRPLLAPLSLIEPSLSRLCLGMIEADRVPEDRLGVGRTPLPGRCP
ncbi:MAG: hypothetical protein ABIQ86_02790 [Steroidobacteraceae bacterium]